MPERSKKRPAEPVDANSLLLFHLDLFRRAEEFMQAYRDLPQDRPPPDWPRYFLLCQSIELVLKAYLVARGFPPRHVRQIGHSLKTLMSSAVGLGLAIGANARGEIEALDEAHAEHWARYPNPAAGGTKPVFIIDQFEPHVVELFGAVGKALGFKSSAQP
jgi:hypothetical protein